MALTRNFRETVVARIKRDPAFAQALLDEAATLFLNGEPETAELILRELVNATSGFEALAIDVRKPSKSLHRMLSQAGNPTMESLSAIFVAIKKALHVDIKTVVTSACLPEIGRTSKISRASIWWRSVRHGRNELSGWIGMRPAAPRWSEFARECVRGELEVRQRP